MDGSDLLFNLAIALAAAFIGATLALRLGQSTMLGYLLAGVVIGQYTPGVVGDIETVDALASVGVVLLMFAIGLQLSLRDLARAGRVVTVGALSQVLLMIAIGYAAGLALGWGHLPSLFFGAVLSNSSSTVISKVMADRGELGAPHGPFSIAWSSIQDLSTIALVVILTALANGGDVLRQLGGALLLAGLFLVLILPIGSRVLPRLLESVARIQNREAFVMTIAAIAIGIAYVSQQFGVSLALGAFIAGVVVSESELSHHILGEITPLRDIFAGLFFVSIGMLLDPLFVLRNLPLVALAVLLIVVVKGTLSAAIAAGLGVPRRTAILAGVALAQSAEFSFLLARLGTDLGVVSGQIFSLMLAGAIVSILLSPALHRLGQPLAAWSALRASSADLATIPEGDTAVLRRHAILCGYGRVGQVIGEILQRRGLRFVVIEQDSIIVRRLRDQHIPALLGSADNEVLLEQARLAEARLLILAIPDAVTARRAVDLARRVNPRVEIVARSHSREDRGALIARGADEAVIGEVELALEMARFALHRFGIGTLEIQALLQRLRRDPDQPARLIDE